MEKSKQKTRMHASISPSVYNWIATGAGKAGLAYNYVITMDSGAVELYIDRGKDAAEINKQIFDALYAKKEEIEAELGGGLKRGHVEGRRACRIRFTFEEAGLKDEDRWDDLQDKVIDAMIRLERSLGKHIRELSI